MKKTFLALAVLASMVAVNAFGSQYGGYGDVQVDGYQRQDGTYVQPHYRTQPDEYQFNNYSYKEPGISKQHPVRPQKHLGGDEHQRLGPRNQRLGTGNDLGW